MKKSKLIDIDHKLIRNINKQVLALVCEVASADPIRSQVVFGISEKLSAQLALCSDKEIDNLSQQPICLLTLRSCGDEALWNNLLLCAKEYSQSHQLNLQALMLVRTHNNKLPECKILNRKSDQVHLDH